MATVQEINHLYATQLGSVPTQADYDAWAGYSGDQLYNSFTSAAQSDPRYGTTYNPASVGIDGGYNGTVGENTWVNGVMNGGTAGTGAGGLGQPLNNEALGALQGSIDSGFTGVNSGIAGVNTAVQGVGDSVNTGFSTVNDNMNTGFNTTNQNLDTGFNAMTTNFNTLNDQNAARDSALNTYLASLNTGVMDTLGGIGNNLNQVGTDLTQVGSNLDTYYGDLSNNQATMGGTLDNLKSDFGDYRMQYDNDVIAANKKRAEIAESVAGTAVQTQNMLGQQGPNAAGQVAPQAGPPQAPQAPNPIVNTLSMARDTLASNQNINPQAASMLSEFLSSFTPDGQLISNGPDANGIPTIRNMNNQGVMQIAKQNAQGQYVTSGVTSPQQIQALIQAISMPQGLGAV